MPPALKFRMTGTKEMQRALEEVSHIYNKSVLTKILIKNGQPIADHASSLVRRRTGALARSAAVSTQLTPRQRSLEKSFANPGQYATQVYIGFGAFYAHFQEFGTVYNSPRPALRPAWEGGKQAMWEGVRRDLAAHMERMVSKYRRMAAE